MKRNRIILLNKANKALKILTEKYKFINLTVNYSSVDLTFPGTTTISHEAWEELIVMFKEDNTNWKLSFIGTYIVLNIWI